MKKNYLLKCVTAGLFSCLLIGNVNAQTTDTYRIWAKDANFLEDYYYWEAVNAIKVQSTGTNFVIPTENGVDQGVNYAWNNCFLKFNNIDFGTFSDSLTFVRNVPRGAIIEFWIDRTESTRFDTFFNVGGTYESPNRNVIELSGGKFLGSYQHWYDETGNWNRWEKHKIAINRIGGKHTLYVLFRIGGASGTTKTVGGLYYVDLHRKLNDEATAISAPQTDLELTIGKHSLQYTVEPATASTEDLVWTVESGSDVVSVDNGSVIAMKPGIATVKCTSSRATGDVSLVYNITIVGTSTKSANRIEAETANAIYNTYIAANGQPFAIGSLLESGNGDGLNYSWNTNFAVYNNVDFGSFSDSLSFRHAEIRGSAVEFWIDRNIEDETDTQRGITGTYNNPDQKVLTGGTFLGRYEFLRDNVYVGGASTWKEYKLPIVPTSGTHTLYVVFLRGGKGTYEKTTGHWDWFELDRKIVNIQSITPSKSSVNLKVGDEETIALTLNPEVVYDSNIIWSVEEGSENATVDQNGKITAVAAGTAKIRATANADSNIFTEITVNITDLSTETATQELNFSYKNPISDEFAFTASSILNNITVKDLSGRIVYKQNAINSSEIKLNSSKWSSGIYIISIESDTATKTLKITKQ